MAKQVPEGMGSPGGADLVEQLRVADQGQRRAAAARYRELLLRADNPEAGDIDELPRVMSRLGRAVGQVLDDVALVRELADLKATEQRMPALDAAWRKAAKQRREELARVAAEKDAAIKRWEAEEAAAAAALGRARAPFDVAQTALAKLPVLRGRWEAIETGLTAMEVNRLETRVPFDATRLPPG